MADNIVDSLLVDTEISLDLLAELDGLAGNMVRQLNSVNVALDELKRGNRTSSRVIEAEIDRILYPVRENAPFYLSDEVYLAATSTDEYSQPILLGPLMEAAKSTENFTFSVSRHGWSSRLSVTVDMDPVAGTIEQWAMGVKRARELLKNPLGKDPIKSSDAWKTKIWSTRGSGGSPYQTTIGNRLSESGAIAPYWKLLDEGIVPMSSDRGGYPWPPLRATNFTQKTEEKIKSVFYEQMAAARSRFNRVIEKLTKEQELLEANINKLDTIIEAIQRADFAAIESIYAKFRNIRDSVDLAKVNRAIMESLLGIGVSRVTKEGRLEITASGATKRIRIPVSALSNITGGY